jgi:predicted transcriptional regulator of viral defense system
MTVRASDKKTGSERSSWCTQVAAALAVTGPRVFLQGELQNLFENARAQALIPNRLSLAAFVDGLLDNDVLRRIELKSVGSETRKPFTRYTFGAPPAWPVALSLRPRSYLSHASALMLHGLTPRQDFPVYVNQEQSPKPGPRGTLRQEAVDRAFQNQPRVSTYVFRYELTDIVLLNGKNTGNYGVAEYRHVLGATYPVTSIARTLVDITVRPSYAGTPHDVLEAFKRAQRLQSAESLIHDIGEALDAVDHLYPYHQVIGFYLERAGVSTDLTDVLRARGAKVDFYTGYKIGDPAYDERWRLYYDSDLS